MRHFFMALREGLVEHRRAILTLAGIAAAVVLVFQVAFYFVSARSELCGTCHIMTPYLEMWRASSHRDVACVECHSEYRYALSRVWVKYALGIYTTQLRAEVPDARCLACHQHQDLDTDEMFLKNIHFSHQGHMGEMRRGKRLHCTSCHTGSAMAGTSIAQREHVVLQEQVCFTCHFKGAEAGQAATGCLVCHGPPSTVVTHHGIEFDHETYLKRGVRCETCHTEVTRGDANVPRERCWSCHVAHMEAYEDPVRVHEIHVQRRIIDCRRCHNTLEHGKFTMTGALGDRCESCHTPVHTPQEKMYVGIGGRGVPDTPDTMFLARVACNSCHVPTEGGPAAAGKALRESCVTCHGPGYGRMVDDWRREIGSLLATVDAQVRRAEGMVSRLAASHAQPLVDARHNVEFVRSAGGHHNVHYAVDLLRHANDQAAATLRAAGVAVSPPPAVLASAAGYCRVCHSTAHLGTRLPFGPMFYDHNRHIAAGIGCDSCHSLDEHGKTAITAEQCMACHHGPTQQRSCESCHQQQASLYRGELAGTGIKGDPDFMAAADTACTDCHDLTSRQPLVKTVQQACIGCHDASYGDMLIQWINEDQQRLQELAVLLVRARSAAREPGQRQAVARAEAVHQALLAAKGSHNTLLADEAAAQAKKLLAWAR